MAYVPHTYSTLLLSVGTQIKVMQELLRHSSLRSTLDVYTQAISPAKHAAQAVVLALAFPLKPTPSQSRKRDQIVKAAQLKPLYIDNADARRAQNCTLLHPPWFSKKSMQAIERNGGDDGTRTRGLCRDRAAF
jgi:hypothetical protein